VQSVGRAVGKIRFNRIDTLQPRHIGVSISMGNVIRFRSWTALTLQLQRICRLLYEFASCLIAINHSEQFQLLRKSTSPACKATAEQKRTSRPDRGQRIEYSPR
jgi:hypothetical protein